MVNRFEDLAPLVAPTGVARGSTVGFRQGVVESWNPNTAENTIRIGGTLFTNLPSLASSSEVLLIKPGDVVSIKVVSGNSAFDTMYIEGRVTVPGTPQAGSFMELFGAKVSIVASSQSTTSSTYGDLATVGPVIQDVLVGKTGRLLVLWGCMIEEVSTDLARGGSMSFEVSGATSLPADTSRRYEISHTDDGILNGSLSASSNNLFCRALAGHLLEGLNPGLHTLTAKYRSGNAGRTVRFSSRIMIAIPF